MPPFLYMTDETGPVTDVFVHAPGPETLIAFSAEDPAQWLFDPALKGVDVWEWLAAARKEHHALVQILHEQGVRVHSLAGLLKPKVREVKAALEDAVIQAYSSGVLPKPEAERFWKHVQVNPIGAALMGVQLPFGQYKQLASIAPLLVPKPNAYFAQDPVEFVGGTLVVCRMANWQRSGEPLLWQMALWDRFDTQMTLDAPGEGGDITVADRTLYVGIGTRTTREAALQLYDAHACGQLAGIEEVVLVLKPDAEQPVGKMHSREFPYLHLDTIANPLPNGGVVGNLHLMQQSRVWRNGSSNGPGESGTLADFVQGHRGHEIVPASPSEQYTLAPNVLPLNGAVIAGEMNTNTNAALARAGHKVVPFSAAALFGGGNGLGHCMANVAARRYAQ